MRDRMKALELTTHEMRILRFNIYQLVQFMDQRIFGFEYVAQDYCYRYNLPWPRLSPTNQDLAIRKGLTKIRGNCCTRPTITTGQLAELDTKGRSQHPLASNSMRWSL